MLTEFTTKHKLGKAFLDTARKWYVPLAEKLRQHQLGAKKTFYVGLNGSQGSGKSTLADFLKTYLHDKYQLNVIVMSLDDFYLDQSRRLALSIKVHPLFTTRGVPGTHNIAHAKQLLIDLGKTHKSLALPKFDKATDNPQPEKSWPTTQTPVDIVIFEGWCWGVEAQDDASLSTAINELERCEDETAVWRRYVNRQLATRYQPLYPLMDFWIMLKAPSFEDVYAWRVEQEQKLIAATPDVNAQGLMSPKQISRFIQYYQRLTEHSLHTLADKCDWVFELDSARHIVRAKSRSEYA
ncbi:MAG: D-glycerate 3-kinase [Paraglaciecola sp.]|jgi:D-glycerate 3-kinase